MPRLILPPGFAQCLLRWRLTGDPEEMICTLAVDAGGLTDPAIIANAVATSWANNLGGTTDMYIGWTFVGVTAYLGQDGGDPTIGLAEVNNDGTSTGETPVQNTTMLVRKVTGLGGRQHRGRMYVPCATITEADISKAGVLGSSAVTAHQSLLDAFYSDLTTDPLSPVTPVLLHSSSLVLPTPIESFQLDSVVATQRQRLRR